MTHSQKLEQIYQKALTSNSSSTFKLIDKELKFICQNIEKAKGVYTVLLTLLVQKILNPEEDIRNHQAKMKAGVSYRGIDTKFITPTLKKLKLPSMAESGWLTRSLEKNAPYNLNYDADIKPKGMTDAFLKVIDYFQVKDTTSAEKIAIELIRAAIKVRDANVFEIKKLDNTEKNSIDNLVNQINKYMHIKFNIQGAAKIPVILMYSLFQQLIKEVDRYKLCELKKLASHTAPDRNSRSCGDIEIFKNAKLFEAFEIKLDKEVDNLMIDVAIEKIYQFSPHRYYIVSTKEIKKSEELEIKNKILKLKKNHGCELIITEIFESVKFYLSTFNKLEDFLKIFSDNIFNDNELKTIHKKEWESILNSSYYL